MKGDDGEDDEGTRVPDAEEGDLDGAHCPWRREGWVMVGWRGVGAGQERRERRSWGYSRCRAQWW